MRPEWQVDLPEGKRGDIEIRKFTVERDSIEAMRLRWQGRGIAPGQYTALYRKGKLWMSDTDAEVRDHYEPDSQIRSRGGRTLIAGLGLGMVVKRALSYPNVEHVDVIEIDPDVAELVGQHYASERCTIHVADIFTLKWPVGSRWSYAWFDIWPTVCEDNLESMGKLARSYGRRVDAQGFWSKEQLVSERRRTRDAWWRR